MIGVLGLEDGTKVEGVGFGAPGIVSGELVFVTVMSGYGEALTDPSYKGQLLMFTYPLQGNYGVGAELFQSDRIQTTAMICKEIWDRPFHYKSTRTLSKFLEDEGIPGVHGLDTRMLTTKIRNKGAMKAALAVGEASDVVDLDLVKLAREQPDISSQDLISKVTCQESYHIPGKGSGVVVMDLGIKRNILNSLSNQGFNITVVPASSSISDIERAIVDRLV